MERYFAHTLPAQEFARNTLIVSLLTLVPLLILFVALSPGFASHLANDGPALSRFLRQVLTNGLPVVFAVNYVGFFIFAVIASEPERIPMLRWLILLDLPLRVILFIVLHALIFVLSADWFDSFGGSKTTALQVVAPTLARSALFENISGVYLYAAMLASLPVYAEVFDKACLGRTATSGLTSGFARWLFALTVCGVFVIALTVLARLIMRFQA
jgi:hypothetical protein